MVVLTVASTGSNVMLFEKGMLPLFMKTFVQALDDEEACIFMLEALVNTCRTGTGRAVRGVQGLCMCERVNVDEN